MKWKQKQTEDSGVHPECEYDEFGFRIDRSKFSLWKENGLIYYDVYVFCRDTFIPYLVLATIFGGNAVLRERGGVSILNY